MIGSMEVSSCWPLRSCQSGLVTIDHQDKNQWQLKREKLKINCMDRFLLKPESSKLRAEEKIYLYHITGMNAFQVAEDPGPHLKWASSQCRQNLSRRRRFHMVQKWKLKGNSWENDAKWILERFGSKQLHSSSIFSMSMSASAHRHCPIKLKCFKSLTMKIWASLRIRF